MRITGGRLKGRALQTRRGKGTRPALSRVRCALFDALEPWLTADAEVLDLFAGSGAFLFEAISRGAGRATGIDLSGDACRVIRENAAHLGIAAHIELFRNDALAAVAQLGRRPARFDVVLIAPPYWKSLQPRALQAIDRACLLRPEAVVVVQRDRQETFPEPSLETLERVRERTYGNTVIEFFQQREDG